MGIEPESYSPDVVEIANDKCDSRPKPSKSQAVMTKSRYEIRSFRRVLSGLEQAHVRILGRFQRPANGTQESLLVPMAGVGIQIPS